MYSFRNRILLILLGLVLVTQLATVAGFAIHAKSEAQTSAATDLKVAGNMLDALLSSRGQQLSEGVRVLAADFGFKSAAATADALTLQSALANASQRIGADTATFVDLSGRVVASTDDLINDTRRLRLDLPDQDARGTALTYQSLHGTLYMLVVAQVRTPLPIGHVIVGFSVDQHMAGELGKLLGVSVSFQPTNLNDALVSTLDPVVALRTQQLLRSTGLKTGAVANLLVDDDTQYVTLVRDVPGSNSKVQAVLQQPLLTALASYLNSRWLIALLAVPALALAVPLASWLAGQASKPIEALVSSAKRIESGDYTQTTALRGAGEFKRVASTLNSMQLRIAEREQHIQHLAMHDLRTGLPNRAMALQWLTQAISADKPLVLLLLEVNDFTRIEASLGHEPSDALLSDIAQRIQRHLQDSDLLALIGPAQFLVVQCQLATDSAEDFAQQLINALHVGLVIDSTPVSLDARVGLCFFPEHGSTALQLLQQLDTTLHDSGNTIRSVNVSRTDRQMDHKRQLALLAALRQSIQDNALTVNYQPKVGMRDHRVQGLEALARWHHPALGHVSPAEFIPLLEHTRSIWLLTSWLIKTVTDQMGQWRRVGFEPEVSINLSAPDLLEPRLPEHLLNCLADAQVASGKLVLEITESALMSEPEQAIRTMDRLRAQGLRFSIDDFGTGYSSLAQFKALPVDEIKIDRSFIMNLKPGSDDEIIVQATIDLGHRFGVKVVAEGIETPQCWEQLRALGCDMAQGYLISKPLPADQMLLFIQSTGGKFEPAGPGSAAEQISA